MTSDSDMIARSPSPPEPDDDGDEWPVHGIVGEDVDVFGISSYEIRWKNWSRPDGTNTTWMREVEGDPAFVASWNEAMKYQRVEKATESQVIDLTLLASTPMHDRLTFERAEAVEEKMAERLRKGAPGKLYQGWMTEIDRQVAHHEQRGERKSSKRLSRKPSHLRDQEGSYAEGSRSATSRVRGLPRRAGRNMAREAPASGHDIHDVDGDDLSFTTLGRQTPRKQNPLG